MVKKIKVKLIPSVEKKLDINTPFIKLDQALKLSDSVGSGGTAKMIIENEEVRVNGEICTVRGKKLYPGDKFSYDNTVYEITAKQC